MSLEYAQGRIKEALRLSKGNATKARQQIIAWCYDDQKLLLALARPHLTGVVAHAINRVTYNQNLQDEAEALPETPEGVDLTPATFGQEILKSLQSSNTPMFGFEGNVPPVARRKASKSHIDNLKRMAERRADGGEDRE
jgi:hypothetical protein